MRRKTGALPKQLRVAEAVSSLMRIFGWLVGAPLAVFRFLRREIPIVQVDLGAVAPLAPESAGAARREAGMGVGPVVHRRYSATIRAPKLTAERLLAIIAADPNAIAPSEVLRFERTTGRQGRLEEGDELLIRMAGPWNAPVKVTRRWSEGFRLAASRGHPQLGQVELRVRDEEGRITMEIQTRERAAGLGFHVLQRIGLIRRMQSYTWAEMLENAAQLAGGRPLERIAVGSWSEQGSRPAHRVAAADTSKERR
jgi:hypothetical protein